MGFVPICLGVVFWFPFLCLNQQSVGSGELNA